MHYVVCLAFDEAMDHVVLLTKKSGPECVIGRVNGPGGKVEDGETGFGAARREFREETGVDIPEEQWSRFCTLHADNRGWMVEFFYCRTEAVYDVKTVTDEPVFLTWCDNVHTLTLVPNLGWMIPYLRDRSLLKHDLGRIECER